MKDKRRYKRFVVEDLHVHARTVSAVEVDIVNISLGGISVSSPKRLNIGGKYHLRLERPEGLLSVQAEVVWEKLSGSRKETAEIVPIYTAGLRFCDIMSPKMRELKDYVDSLDTEPKHRLTGVRFRIKGNERATVDVPSSYTVKRLSLGGMLIVVDRALAVDETMAMEMMIPGSDAPLDFTGRVASCMELQEGDTASFDIGIEFMRMGEEDKDRLKTFVEGLQDKS